MTMRNAEAIARIECNVGIENAVIRHIAYKNWAIVDITTNEILYTADTEDECKALLEEVHK